MEEARKKRKKRENWRQEGNDRMGKQVLMKNQIKEKVGGKKNKNERGKNKIKRERKK